MALGEYRGPSCAKAFVRYTLARFRRDCEEKVYRAYVTDSLWLLPQMRYMQSRWSELSEKPKTERTADEIIKHVQMRLGE